MKCERWPVTKEDERPARMDGTCFYCRTPIGREHEKGCVIRRRTVVVDFTVRLVVTTPEDSDPSFIEFRFNESSWCADNLIEMLTTARQNLGCLCGAVTAKYVREATEADQERYGEYPA